MTAADRTRRWREKNPAAVAAYAAQHRDHMRAAFALARPGVSPKPFWTSDEEARLRELADSHTAREVGTLLARPRSGVMAKAIRMGVSFASPTTNTALGRLGEAIGLRLLPGARHVSGEDYHAPFDLAWDGQRIDVKACRARFFGSSVVYPFAVDGHVADAYLCLALEGDQLRRAWLIPAWAVATVRHVAIGATRSKYARFELQGVA